MNFTKKKVKKRRIGKTVVKYGTGGFSYLELGYWEASLGWALGTWMSMSLSPDPDFPQGAYPGLATIFCSFSSL